MDHGGAEYEERQEQRVGDDGEAHDDGYPNVGASHVDAEVTVPP